jgi:hypothetical protein
MYTHVHLGSWRIWLYAFLILTGVIYSCSTILQTRIQDFSPNSPLITISDRGEVIQGDHKIGQLLRQGDFDTVSIKVPLPEEFPNDSPTTFLVTLPTAERLAQPFRYQAVVSVDEFKAYELPANRWLLSLPALYSDAHPVLTISVSARTIKLPLPLIVLSGFLQLIANGWEIFIVLPLLLLIIRIIVNKYVSSPRYLSSEVGPFTELSPLEIGILLYGRITESTLVAAIYDLAYRGHIELILHLNGATIYRNRREYELSVAEDLFLQLLVPYTQQSELIGEIPTRIGREQFSTTIGNIYTQAYAEMKDKGWLRADLQQLHLVQKVEAILVQVIGLAAVAAAAFIHTYVLNWHLYSIGFAWYIAGALLFYVAGRARNLSRAGQEVLGAVQKFRDYCKVKEPIKVTGPDAQTTFYRYVGYALLFKNAQEWLNRFGDYVLPSCPDWASSSEIDIVSPAHFLTIFDSRFTQIAMFLSEVKDPNVD